MVYHMFFFQKKIKHPEITWFLIIFPKKKYSNYLKNREIKDHRPGPLELPTHMRMAPITLEHQRKDSNLATM